MPFLSAYGFYHSLLKIRVLYLYCATLVCIILCIGLWWYFLFQPASIAADATQQQLQLMNVQVAELRKSERTLAGLAQSIDALKQNGETNSETKIRKRNEQQSLSLIADCALNCGMSVGSCKLCGERDEAGLCVTSIRADFKGSLDQMIAFFDAMKNSKQIIDISQGEMVRVDSGTFSLHATFNLYHV
jgi:hypothetical protein